jgi:hypothetical protein
MRKWLRAILGWIKNLFCKKTMRRKISLYIGDLLVDLDDQSFILFNYTMDDLENPTIVKNSFSQQITLRGTPTNNKVFGHYFRPDRRISNTGGEIGTDFNASQKTPFTIYNELGEILESGYVKLDSISRNGADIQYKVTLYGGLGSFFYALSYDANGNKRTLADLDYMGTSNPDRELDFTINAAAVQAAWARLRQETGTSAMWDVINFAPAYNGIPEGNFSPDKALVVPSEVGLQDTINVGGEWQEIEVDGEMQNVLVGGVDYTLKGGYALVNLAEAQDEWAVKDLRSYLQRPVLSMKAFWTAICNPANNGGYVVDASIIQDYAKFGNYSALWLTLPMITSAGSLQQQSGGLSLSMTTNATSGNSIGRYNISGSVPSGTAVTANLSCRIRFRMPSGANSYTELNNVVLNRVGNTTQYRYNLLFVQAVAYGSDNSIVGGSKVKVLGAQGRESLTGIAAACGYTPAWNGGYTAVTLNTFNKVTTGIFEIPFELGFTIEAQDVAYYKILVSVYSAFMQVTEGSGGGSTNTSYSGTGSTSTPAMYVDFDNSYTATSSYITQGSSGNSITTASSETLRSGSIITKAMLLSTSHTPAEYMISFCKIFGLYFTYDNATRKVTILRRNDLYQDETIDLTKRVDLSKGISIKPLVFQAKWYDFILEGVGGAFYDEYLNVEGIPYGIQRVNTGYDFNADSINLMDSVVFKNACTILARSKYFNYILQNQGFRPSPFLDKGNTYTLWSADGDTLETDISCPPASASVTYYNDNPAYKGYDINTARKLELRNADNKPIDGSDILVFHEGWNNYAYFKVTDDVPAMNVVNDGVPCWLLGAGQGVNIPIFQRYVYGNSSVIEHSLDFGVPLTLDMPGVSVEEGSTIYERGWKNYISDRYDDDTKVMTCRVDFSGIQVSQALLRKFYWYDNSLWVLNAIRNYSLTTYDPVECEFVQVQDKSNYLNGQTY